MKKILLIAMLFVPLAVFSQDDFEKGSLLFIKLMYNSGGTRYKLSTESDPSHELSKSGFGIGLDYGVVLNENLLVTIGAELNNRGYRMGGAISSASLGSRVKSTYLDLPVSINYIKNDIPFFSYHDKILIGAGAYYGMAISGKYQNNGSWTSMKFGESNADNRSRLDYGLVFNFGYKTTGFPFFMLSYAAGLKNVLPREYQGVYIWRKLNCAKIYFAIPIKQKSKK